MTNLVWLLDYARVDQLYNENYERIGNNFDEVVFSG